MSTDSEHARIQGSRVFDRDREQRRRDRDQQRRQVAEEFDIAPGGQRWADEVFEEARRALVPPPSQWERVNRAPALPPSMWERLKRLFRK